jgi:hypothetical protein
VPESREAQNDIAYIRTHVDNVERLLKFQISANPEAREMIRQHLAARDGAARLYLALEEPRTQAELQTQLQLSQGTVSKILTHLLDGTLIMKVPSLNNAKVTAYSRSDLERVLKVSRIARELLKSTGAKANKPLGQRSKEISDPRSLAGDGAADERESSE